jgi:hypothetical protein
MSWYDFFINPFTWWGMYFAAIAVWVILDNLGRARRIRLLLDLLLAPDESK